MEYVLSLAFGVHILSYCRSFLARRKHFRYKWLYTYLHLSIDRHTHTHTHKHTHIFQRDISQRRQQEDGDTAWTSGIVTISSIDCWPLLLPHVIPSSTTCPHSAWLLSTWCATFLSASCGVAPPPSIWAATTRPAKPHFIFICHSIFASSDVNPSCCTWLNTNSSNQHDDKTLQPNTPMAVLLGSQKQVWELLEQTGTETLTGPWRTGNTRILP